LSLVDVGGGPHPDVTMTVTKQQTCADCGARTVPMVYGLPGPEGLERAERGEIVLGGCPIEKGASPAWKCSNRECGLEFGVLIP
jgi:hypothetical protein